MMDAGVRVAFIAASQAARMDREHQLLCGPSAA
jgi:hypothetical protein